MVTTRAVKVCTDAVSLHKQKRQRRAAQQPDCANHLAPAIAALSQLPSDATVPVFRTEEDIRKAVDHVIARDPVLASIIIEFGYPTKLLAQHSMTTFQSLCKTIIFQQLHGKAASCIHTRFLALAQEQPLTPSVVQAMDRVAMRGCGLSERKVEYLCALADEFAIKHLDEDHIECMSDEKLKEVLTQVKGVGPWSVDMLCMFKLGRQNVLAVGDLAVRKGMQVLYRMPSLPSPQQMESVAQMWHPYRSIGTYCMWRVPTTKASPKKSPKKRTASQGATSEASPPTSPVGGAADSSTTAPVTIPQAESRARRQRRAVR